MREGRGWMIIYSRCLNGFGFDLSELDNPRDREYGI
jgi:hypothetical protein